MEWVAGAESSPVGSFVACVGAQLAGRAFASVLPTSAVAGEPGLTLSPALSLSNFVGRDVP